MTVALRSPRLLQALVSVDNAPIDATLQSEFHKYVRGLQEIEDRKAMTHKEADTILSHYESVSQISAYS